MPPPQLKDKNGKLGRMAVRIKEFDAQIKYRPENQNVLAEGLSRIPTDNAELEVIVNDIDNSLSDDITFHSTDSDDGDYIPITESPLKFFKHQILFKFAIETRRYMKKYSQTHSVEQ